MAAPVIPALTTMNTTLPRAAGRIAGTIARGLIWAYHEIDWAEALALAIACLQVLIVALLLAGRATRRAWAALPGLSERLGRWYSRRLVGEPGITQRIDPSGLAFALDEPEDEAPDYVERRHASRRNMSPPCAVRAIQLWTSRDLEQLTHRELMALAGTRRKLAKRQLIALVTATALGVA